MEPLQELPIEKWPQLQSKLRNMWPLNVAGVYALYLNMEYPKVREAFQFKVYCPFGRMDDGFVATTIKNSTEVIIFTMSEDSSSLEKALVETKLIDWTQYICVDLLNSKTLQIMNRLKPRISFKKYEVGYAITYFIDRKTMPFENITCPKNIYLSSIREEDIQYVDEKWPYKHEASKFYFSTLALNNLSYGLYSSDNELMAWVFLNEYNFICHLYCVEKYRRNGLSSFLLKHVINGQLAKDNDVYGYVIKGNHKSENLFQKLGFSDIDEGSYLYAQKLS